MSGTESNSAWSEKVEPQPGQQKVRPELRHDDSGIDIGRKLSLDENDELSRSDDQNGGSNPHFNRYTSKDSGVYDMESSLKSRHGSFGQGQKFSNIEESIQGQDTAKPKIRTQCVVQVDETLFDAITSCKHQIATDGGRNLISDKRRMATDGGGDVISSKCSIATDDGGDSVKILIQDDKKLGVATNNLHVCTVTRMQTAAATSEPFSLYTRNAGDKICQANVRRVKEIPCELAVELVPYAPGVYGELFEQSGNPGQLQSEKNTPAMIVCKITSDDFTKPTLGAYLLDEFPAQKKQFEAQQPGNYIISDIRLWRTIDKKYYGLAMFYQVPESSDPPNHDGYWYYLHPSGQDSVTLEPVVIQGNPNHLAHSVWSDTQPHGDMRP